MKLKTLKDIKSWVDARDLDKHVLAPADNLRKDIKEEAIKLVKCMKINDDVWKTFFDITEEDLNGM